MHLIDSRANRLEVATDTLCQGSKKYMEAHHRGGGGIRRCEEGELNTDLWKWKLAAYFL